MLSILTITLAVIAAIDAKATFTNVVSFGDSFSDNGNVFKITGAPSAPYYQGRFSNGPVFCEQLATMLGATLTDYAYGGAVSSLNDVPSVLQDAAKAVPDLEGQLALLKNAGRTAGIPGVAGIADTHNSALLNGVKSLKATVYIGDLNKMVTLVNTPAGAAKYGFTNVKDACFTTGGSPCSNPDQYLFWDDLHPTVVGHKALAQIAFDELNGVDDLTTGDSNSATTTNPPGTTTSGTGPTGTTTTSASVSKSTTASSGAAGSFNPHVNSLSIIASGVVGLLFALLV
ncbi:hypothetical protein HDU76_013602 [Blyttiomyces sp. JEL0837]|nr:hypothetical protein HDU76_013602 [Blyttiomyces sp. JEL0837]